MAELFEYKCPSCGALLKISPEESFVKCSYCGTIVERELDDDEKAKASAKKLAQKVEKYKQDKHELDTLKDSMLSKDQKIRSLESSSKVESGFIRALYGHSVPMHISKEPITPPSILYHGTTHKALGAIMKDGLKPMRRQYVHLSVDTDTASQVGKRRDAEPVILKIDAAKAHRDGVKFYKGNDKVVLADFISPEYISM